MRTKLITTTCAAIALFGLIGCATTQRTATTSAGECIVRNGKVYDAAGRPMPACGAKFDGAMMSTLSSGKLAPLKQHMIMSNGVKCLVDGTCVMRDGSRRVLREGELMTPQGNVLRIRRDKAQENPRG